LWWVLVRFVPLAVATGVAATRITDYMHHVSDVVTGAVLGAGVAALVFHVQAQRVVPAKPPKPYGRLTQL